jgi:hypothetical protein
VATNTISRDLQKRIRDLKSKPIQATVSLAEGHDYWWFLEFGTGSRGSTTPAWGLGPEDFKKPASVAGHRRSGAKYPISPVNRKKLFFYWAKIRDWVFIPGGAIAADPKKTNWYPMTKVMHPGIKPRAILRKALWNFRSSVRLDLMNMARRKALPFREQLVFLMNKRLAQLRKDLASFTPVYVPPEPPEGFSPHIRPSRDLAGAWEVTDADAGSKR